MPAAVTATIVTRLALTARSDEDEGDVTRLIQARRIGLRPTHWTKMYPNC